MSLCLKLFRMSDGNTSFLRAARNGQLEKVLEYLKTNIDINTSNANGLNALHLASKDGHVEIVEELLKRGAIVDAATKKGNTALHIASLAGQEEVVKLLVQNGASVNVQSQNGFTPLYMAAQENHDNVVKFLLANGANQSLSTEDGFTPLAVAMQQGHDKVVTVLLENDTRGKVRLPALHIAAKKDDVRAAKLLLENDHNPDVTSKSGFTPLHIASHYGNQPIANLLIQKGADVNYSAKHNITPLHVAAKWGKSNMVSLLLEQGAHIEAKTRDGLTPLHCAARSGHEQVVDMLLEKSAPISSKTKNGLAPLHMAAQGDHVDAARILLYHRAPVDEVTVDYLTALHVAAHCGHVRVAKLLLERQADANARALNGFTPLHIACKKNRIKVVELLLKHGACIGATTESGLTPLHVASFMGCMNIVIYLLQHDASPDIPTVRGETPLHLAARANQTDIIRILLRNGAQVDARAREQQTPLHVASRLGNVDIVMLLLQHGAKIDNTTKDMYTSLHIAAKEGQDEVAGVLIENGASLNSTTKKGFTPLHLAAKYGHLKVAKLLVQKEAPVDAQGKNGVTPLHVASHYDHQNVALLLLEKGASPHAEAKNGHTPLHIAARKNQMDIANTLLEYGAKPDVESKAGFTPLHLSSQEGHVEISSLLLEHRATPDYQSKNGLTPMHLCAQENKVAVADLLHKNGANIDSQTKGGYTPLHIASHYGQADMVKFLLSKGADVKATTSLGYTPLHQAAQQGQTNIVNLLLENSAQPNAITNNGQTPLHIAQKLGYITVIDTLKEVTEGAQSPVLSEEKYRVVAPELMHETFLSDSEEEGEDTLLGDQTYRYLTADEMKSLGDDSLPIDVTRDERVDSNRMVGSDDPNAYPPRHIEDSISPEHIHPNYVEYIKKATDNVDISRHPVNIGKLHWKNFLVSFLVDARGGAMRGCRHSGVRVIVPPRCAPSPTRITCRYVRPQRTPHPPPLMEGEALASRVLELGPVGAKFLGPVIIEVPHFAALREKEREIVILRSDNGESWKEHTVEATEDVLNEVLRDSFDTDDLNQLEDHSSARTTRIITQDFPQYFAVISRIRQEVHAIGPEGGMVSSTVVPQVQAVFPQGALTKKIKVGLQAQPIDPELTAKLLGHGVAVSPVVTVEPRRRKFHKAITLSMPAPRAHSQGMINQYSGSAPTLRLLCSITGGTSRAQWEDVTGSTPLTFVNDCVSFTTTVSARFWLMDCRNIGDATKMATELYREAIHVPFIAKFVVFAKRIDPLEARLRVFCMTDDKEEKTLEYQEQFTEIAKSRDVEVMEGKSQYIEFAGNLVPITKSGEQLQFSFRAFKENRLPFSVRVKDQHAEAVSRCLFMREPKVQKGEPPQQPICILNIVLPDDIVSETISLTDSESIRKKYYANDNFDYYRQDPRLADISNLLGEDWMELANQLGLTSSEVNVIKSEYPDSVAKQAQSMLRMWLSQSGNRVQTNTLENALYRIGREDIANQCLNVDNRNQEILRIRPEEKDKYRLISDNRIEDKTIQDKYYKEEKVTKNFANLDKYSAEEKTFEPSDEEEDFNKTVPERREQIVKRLSTERAIPASSQRVEIVQEITTIKRQSLVEDKIAEVQQKTNIEPMRLTTVKPVSKIIQEKTISESKEPKTTAHIEVKSEQTTKTIIDAQNMEKRDDPNTRNLDNQEKPDRRDSVLLEEVTQLLETKKPEDKLTNQYDPNSPKFSKTPPPSPADFIKEKQATTNQEWNATEDIEKFSRLQHDETKEDKSGKTRSTNYLIKLDNNFNQNNLYPLSVAFSDPSSRQNAANSQEIHISSTAQRRNDDVDMDFYMAEGRKEVKDTKIPTHNDEKMHDIHSDPIFHEDTNIIEKQDQEASEAYLHQLFKNKELASEATIQTANNDTALKNRDVLRKNQHHAKFDELSSEAKSQNIDTGKIAQDDNADHQIPENSIMRTIEFLSGEKNNYGECSGFKAEIENHKGEIYDSNFRAYKVEVMETEDTKIDDKCPVKRELTKEYHSNVEDSEVVQQLIPQEKLKSSGELVGSISELQNVKASKPTSLAVAHQGLNEVDDVLAIKIQDRKEVRSKMDINIEKMGASDQTKKITNQFVNREIEQYHDVKWSKPTIEDSMVPDLRRKNEKLLEDFKTSTSNGKVSVADETHQSNEEKPECNEEEQTSEHTNEFGILNFLTDKLQNDPGSGNDNKEELGKNLVSAESSDETKNNEKSEQSDLEKIKNNTNDFLRFEMENYHDAISERKELQLPDSDSVTYSIEYEQLQKKNSEKRNAIKNEKSGIVNAQNESNDEAKENMHKITDKETRKDYKNLTLIETVDTQQKTTQKVLDTNETDTIVTSIRAIEITSGFLNNEVENYHDVKRNKFNENAEKLHVLSIEQGTKVVNVSEEINNEADKSGRNEKIEKTSVKKDSVSPISVKKRKKSGILSFFKRKSSKERKIEGDNDNKEKTDYDIQGTLEKQPHEETEKNLNGLTFKQLHSMTSDFIGSEVKFYHDSDRTSTAKSKVMDSYDTVEDKNNLIENKRKPIEISIDESMGNTSEKASEYIKEHSQLTPLEKTIKDNDKGNYCEKEPEKGIKIEDDSNNSSKLRNDTTNFLCNEIQVYHDVKNKKSDIQFPETDLARNFDSSEIIPEVISIRNDKKENELTLNFKQEIERSSEFLNNEIKNYHDAKDFDIIKKPEQIQISVSETKQPEGTENEKNQEEQIKMSEERTRRAKKDLDKSENVESPKSVKKQKKSGVLGFFKRKSSKERKSEEEKKVKEDKEKHIKDHKPEIGRTKDERTPELQQNTNDMAFKELHEATVDFLGNEISKYYDSKPQDESELKESKPEDKVLMKSQHMPTLEKKILTEAHKFSGEHEKSTDIQIPVKKSEKTQDPEEKLEQKIEKESETEDPAKAKDDTKHFLFDEIRLYHDVRKNLSDRESPVVQLTENAQAPKLKEKISPIRNGSERITLEGNSEQKMEVSSVFLNTEVKNHDDVKMFDHLGNESKMNISLSHRTQGKDDGNKENQKTAEKQSDLHEKENSQNENVESPKSVKKQKKSGVLSFFKRKSSKERKTEGENGKVEESDDSKYRSLELPEEKDVQTNQGIKQSISFQEVHKVTVDFLGNEISKYHDSNERNVSQLKDGETKDDISKDQSESNPTQKSVTRFEIKHDPERKLEQQDERVFETEELLKVKKDTKKFLFDEKRLYHDVEQKSFDKEIPIKELLENGESPEQESNLCMKNKLEENTVQRNFKHEMKKSSEFLNNEIQNYNDVKNFDSSGNEKRMNVSALDKKRSEVAENEESQKKHKKETNIDQKEHSKKENVESPKSVKKQKKSGVLSFFKRKSSKERSIEEGERRGIVENADSIDLRQEIHKKEDEQPYQESMTFKEIHEVTSDFLGNEITRYQDAQPRSVGQVKASETKPDQISKESETRHTQKEFIRQHDLEEKLEQTSEKKFKHPSNMEHDTKKFLSDEERGYHDVQKKTTGADVMRIDRKTHEDVHSSEEIPNPIHASDKNDDYKSEICSRQKIEISNEFLSNEVKIYHDVRPSGSAENKESKTQASVLGMEQRDEKYKQKDQKLQKVHNEETNKIKEAGSPKSAKKQKKSGVLSFFKLKSSKEKSVDKEKIEEEDQIGEVQNQKPSEIEEKHSDPVDDKQFTNIEAKETHKFLVTEIRSYQDVKYLGSKNQTELGGAHKSDNKEEKHDMKMREKNGDTNRRNHEESIENPKKIATQSTEKKKKMSVPRGISGEVQTEKVSDSKIEKIEEKERHRVIVKIASDFLVNEKEKYNDNFDRDSFTPRKNGEQSSSTEQKIDVFKNVSLAEKNGTNSIIEDKEIVASHQDKVGDKIEKTVTFTSNNDSSHELEGECDRNIPQIEENMDAIKVITSSFSTSEKQIYEFPTNSSSHTKLYQKDKNMSVVKRNNVEDKNEVTEVGKTIESNTLFTKLSLESEKDENETDETTNCPIEVHDEIIGEYNTEVQSDDKIKSKGKKTKTGIIKYLKDKLSLGHKEDIGEETSQEVNADDPSEQRAFTSTFLLEEQSRYEDSQKDGNSHKNNEPLLRKEETCLERKETKEVDAENHIEQLSQPCQTSISINETVIKVQVKKEESTPITQAYLEKDKNYECTSVETERSKFSTTESEDNKNDVEAQNEKRITSDFLMKEQQLYETADIKPIIKQKNKIESEIICIEEVNSKAAIDSEDALNDSNLNKTIPEDGKETTSKKKSDNEKTAKSNKKKGIMGFLKKKSKDADDFSPTDKSMENENQKKFKKESSKDPPDVSLDYKNEEVEGKYKEGSHTVLEITEKEEPIKEKTQKEDSKGILGFLFKKKKPKDKDETPTYHKAEDFIKTLEETKSFLHKETEMYHDMRDAASETSNSKQNISDQFATPADGIASDDSKTDKNYKKDSEETTIYEVETVIPEYTALDFIKEEVELFEKSRIPNTTKVDSSIRIETEVETIDDGCPKDIITKRIFISEKLVEQLGQSDDSSTSQDILKRLMNANKELRAQLNMDGQTLESEILKKSEDKSSRIEENAEGSLQKMKQTLSGQSETEETEEKVSVQGIDDIVLEKSNIVQDVSMLERSIHISKNKKQELVTDLDDITSDEHSSLDSRHAEEFEKMIREKFPEFSDEQIVITDGRLGPTYEVRNSDEQVLSDGDSKKNESGKSHKGGSITKLNELGTVVGDVVYSPEDLVPDLKVEYSPYMKEAVTSIESDVSAAVSKRKPLFRIESEEDNNSSGAEVGESSNKNKVLDDLLRQLRMDDAVEPQEHEEKIEMNVEKTENVSIETIERKLCDLGKALETLEQLDETASSDKTEAKERKLRRVERKFERMASEIGEKSVENSKSAKNEQYQQLVSQLSQEEVMTFQGDYNNLWDEYTFSKSDEWDSKTPDSQADVLELPQGETSQAQETFDTTSKDRTMSSDRQEGDMRQQPSDQHQLSDEMKELLREMEEASKK